MYKHHSYNNLVERKLQQLPAADADGLWSSMEAILDQQMPQKKRRPGLLGWLFTHKAWMVTALMVGTAAGTSLVYFTAGNSPVAQPAPLTGTAASRSTQPTLAAPAAAPAATPATAGQQGTTVPATQATDASLTTTTNTTQNTANHTAEPAQPTASTHRTATSFNNNTPAGADGTLNAAPVASSSDAIMQGADHGPARLPEADNSQAIQWAATASAVAQREAAAPSVDPGTVRLEAGTLEQLSQHIATASAAAQKRGRLPQEKGPYVGVVAGLDMSSVAFGSMKAGNNKGFIAGYAFNNRWSVESGLLWNRKNYSADGSYYKADGYTPQPGLTILDVNSVNQVFELPLNVKYNILTGRHRMFATAGVSSYFMKKELIDLSYEYNGQRGSQYDVYRNASKHWLSVAGFSLGYTHKLGSLGSLRVEPYVKLPLRELGVSNMRVTSTGVNVGFTRQLRR